MWLGSHSQIVQFGGYYPPHLLWETVAIVGPDGFGIPKVVPVVCGGQGMGGGLCNLCHGDLCHEGKIPQPLPHPTPFCIRATPMETVDRGLSCKSPVRYYLPSPYNMRCVYVYVSVCVCVCISDCSFFFARAPSLHDFTLMLV